MLTKKETRIMMRHTIYLLSILIFVACGNKKPESSETPVKVKATSSTETFNADSAFQYTKAQTKFGPRVPGTEAHLACANYYKEKFTSWGASVEIEEFTARGYEGTLWQGKNIIASFQPEATTRILLCAHWDSRFIAEEDKDPTLQKKAIDGANDGASGVGVLMEVARVLQAQPANVGVDIVLFDVEDQGAPSYAATAATENSWCLGSQYWSTEAKKNGYQAKFGILLDMVGAGDAVFMKEQISTYYAPSVVDYVWQSAANLGYSDYFINRQGGTVTDDHLYVNQIAGIPCIDIIDFDSNRGGFSHTWHTHDDTIENINKNTLAAVGHVLLKVVYEQ